MAVRLSYPQNAFHLGLHEILLLVESILQVIADLGPSDRSNENDREGLGMVLHLVLPFAGFAEDSY